MKELHSTSAQLTARRSSTTTLTGTDTQGIEEFHGKSKNQISEEIVKRAAADSEASFMSGPPVFDKDSGHSGKENHPSD